MKAKIKSKPKTKVKQAPPAKPPEAPAASSADDNVTAKIPARVLAAHQCGDGESVRYALSGVRFEQHEGRPYAVASDGRRMIVATWNPSEGPQLSCLVSGTLCCLGYDAARQMREDHAEVSAKSVSIGSNGSQAVFHDKALEGKFPKWWECFSRAKDFSATFTVNAKLLRDLLDSIMAVSGSDTLRISVQPDQTAAIVLSVVGEDDVKVSALLMPVQEGSEEVKGPAWMPPMNFDSGSKA